MVFTKKKFFEIQFLNKNSNEFKEYYPKDNEVDTYIVGEKHESFIIKMRVNSGTIDDTKIYGTKLFLDGEEVKGMKTFKKYGRYFGFKCGGGVYKSFLFGAPSYSEEKTSEVNRKIGTIKIIFYTTFQLKSGKRNRQGRFHYQQREEKFLNNDKKLCFKSLQVLEGNTFDNGHTTRQRLKYRNDDNFQTFIDYEDDIDDIELNYADFYGLIALGEISSFNVNHLRYMPTLNLDYFLCGNAISTIIQYYNKNKEKTSDLLSMEIDDSLSIGIDKLEELYKSFAEHSLNLYYGIKYEGSLEKMITTEFPTRFGVNNGFVYILADEEGKEIMKLVQDQRLLKNEYIITPNEQKIINANNKERALRKVCPDVNISHSMNIDPSSIIDLRDYDD